MSDQSNTPRVLESYVCGEWRKGTRDGKPLLNAATGGVVALIDASGLDHAAALDYGRSVGGPALRRLTIHQRALMLKEIGLKLLEMKDDFYRESLWTGATRADGWVDIEGGIGTMLTMASKARRVLDVIVSSLNPRLCAARSAACSGVDRRDPA